MGYTSDLHIMCEKEAFKILEQEIEKDRACLGVEPEKIMVCGNIYYISYNCIYLRGIEEKINIIKGINYLMDKYPGEHEGFGFKAMDIGEDNDEIIYYNRQGDERFCEFQIERNIIFPDSLPENEFEEYSIDEKITEQLRCDSKKSDIYRVHLRKLKEPYIVNGFNVRNDKIDFSCYEEMVNFLGGKPAYDYIDNQQRLDNRLWKVTRVENIAV